MSPHRARFHAAGRVIRPLVDHEVSETLPGMPSVLCRAAPTGAVGCTTTTIPARGSTAALPASPSHLERTYVFAARVRHRLNGVFCP